MRSALVLVALLLAGCGITKEQIEAMQGQSAAICMSIAGQYQAGVANYGGKSVGTAGGGGTVECGNFKFTFNNEGKLPPATITTTTKVSP